MTPTKVREALHHCAVILEKHGARPVKLSPDAQGASSSERANHALAMCREAAAWGDERVEKMFRWLGFVQGVIWAFELATVDSLKNMNKPNDGSGG